jgi:flagellar biosynthesis protein FliR
MALQQDLSQMLAFNAMAMPLLNNGLLIFCRTVAFFQHAPILGRKDVPILVKISLCIIITTMLVYVVPTVNVPTNGMFVWLVAGNVIIGSLFGLLLDMVMQAIISSGAILNNQIGLSAANVMDPSRRTQTALLESFFVFVVSAVFINMNGLHWLISFLCRSFSILPINTVKPDIFKHVGMEYVVNLTGDCLKVGVEAMAAAFIGTLFMDVVLGVINRSAQQIPVFQLSNSIKPVVGIAILLLTLPMFIDTVQHHIIKHLQLF